MMPQRGKVFKPTYALRGGLDIILTSGAILLMTSSTTWAGTDSTYRAPRTAKSMVRGWSQMTTPCVFSPAPIRVDA
ncbi:MAG: hypothetical protein A2W68_18620 [Betaproteobacteria bacterium RIFCSPLOWO2_02_64_14]|nr:MAG: hypothetical protein A2W68_18620 [Betaproteobacteria bacterium RIFCSPLOWO2_02_64_14]